MRVTYDKSTDTAYIYFADTITDNEVADTYPIDEEFDLNGMVNLDLDKSGKLIGLEVLRAKSQLPAEVLRRAEIIG